MKRIISILIIVGLLTIVVIQLAQNKKEAENRVYQYDKEAPVKVFGEVVKDKSETHNKTFSGLFESMNEVKVSADIQGKITQIFVKEGQKVSKGQALLKMDDQMLQLQLNVLETKLDALKKDESRYQTLSNEDAVPAITLEKTQNAIATIEAEKKTILEQINNSTVRAPFNGVVSMRFCEVGGFASPAVPLFELINQTELKFVINVPEEDLYLFTENQHYSVTTGITANSSSASLSQVSSKGGMGNSFKVEFALDNSSGIKPKMNGELKFVTNQSSKDALTISSKAIIGSESNPEIYVVSNGKAVRTPISILSRNGDYLSVKGEINKGDTIVIGGFINLFDNANVIVNQ